MKKIKNLLLTIFIICFPVIVKANSIDKIDMDIYIDKSGTAHVTEVWSANLNEGTEGYKSYYNLGKAKITNFMVTENNKTYSFNSSWNTSDSFSNKAYKNGISYVENGLELCWGISNYGYHNYKLTYDIEGFAVTLNDSDMVYWQLIPYELSQKPGSAHIKIYSDEKYSDDLPVWGYGKYGATAYVYDGYIEMNSEGVLNTNEYMTILIKFDKGTFNTYNSLNSNFNYYLNMANMNSNIYKKTTSKTIKTSENTLKTDYEMFLFIAIMVIILVAITAVISFIELSIKKTNDKKVGSKKMDFDQNSETIPDDVDIMRDIPFNKNIYRTFWIATAYKLNEQKTDFLGAILLKWLLEKKIILKKETRKILFKKIEEDVIELPQESLFNNEVELKLYNMMYSASHNGILRSRRFKRWCKINFRKILKWFENALDYETDNLINEGMVTLNKEIKLKLFKSYTYKVNSSMREDGIKLKGLKNFLDEFSRIDDKEAIEVNMWEYYLIYAQILGIADKVAKQFKKLYPEIIEKNNYGYTYSDWVFIKEFSHEGIMGALTSKAFWHSSGSSSDSYSRASSYSSGGGGFSSGGGGGGSFGGGGGGGGFR